MNPWQSLIDPEAAMPRSPAQGKTVRAFEEPGERVARKTDREPGDVVGQWTLIEFIPGRKKPVRVTARWLCQCSCGKVKEVQSHNLSSGISQSCGHGRAAILSEAMSRYHANKVAA